MNYIMDGEIHALCKEWAYIIQKTNAMHLLPEDENRCLETLKKNFMIKYADYLFTHDKYQALTLVANYFLKIMEESDGVLKDKLQFIYRIPENHMICKTGTFSMKFRRCEVVLPCNT